MNVTASPAFRTTGNRRIYTALYLLYLVLLFCTIGHHELWGDELHSWNIAKASGLFTELLHNIRYEGHPPLWYTLIWVLSKLTHDLQYLQYLQFIIISGAVYLLMFRSPQPSVVKILLPFGYYLLYEYGTFSRNYAIGVLLACCICLLLQRKPVKDSVGYYFLLFLLANTHLLGALLAASLHFYFLLQPNSARKRLTALCFGFIAIFPAVFFIFPPGDSQMNVDFWFRIWDAKRLTDMVTAPVKAFAPVPPLHEPHFWNAHFTDHFSLLLKAVCSVLMITIAALILRKDKRSLALFLVNLLLTFAVAFIFPLNTARYTGFIFIGFIMSVWLYSAHNTLPKRSVFLLSGLLILQILGSAIALPKDWHHPFSNAYRVNELLEKVPPTDSLVSSYWCLNNAAAYADKPFYCLELNKRVSFLLWDKKMSVVSGAHHVFTNGFHRVFQEMPVTRVWMLSSDPPEVLQRKDDSLFVRYKLQLKQSIEGAIEKHSDLYLYDVTPIP